MPFVAGSGETLTAIQSILNNVHLVFTAAIGWVANVASAITGNTVLTLFCIGVPLCGLGVGMFNRLLHSRG